MIIIHTCTELTTQDRLCREVSHPSEVILLHGKSIPMSYKHTFEVPYATPRQAVHSLPQITSLNRSTKQS